MIRFGILSGHKHLHWEISMSGSNLARKITSALGGNEDARDGLILVQPNGLIIDANESILELLGFKKYQIMDMYLSDLVLELTGPQHDTSLAPLIISGLAKSVPLTIKRKNGGTTPILLTSSPVGECQGYQGALCLIKDMTAAPSENLSWAMQLQSQKTNKELIELMDSLLFRSSDLFLFLDETGRIMRSNPKAQKLLGYSEQELAKMNLTDVLLHKAQEDMNVFIRADELLRRVDSGKVIHLKGFLRNQSEQAVHVSLTAWQAPTWAAAMFTGFNNKNGVIVLARDIRESKLLRDLKIKQQHLIQSAKLASLGELSGGIAHEINNSLSVINGFAQILQQEYEKASEEVKAGLPKLEAHLNRIEDASAKIAHTVQTIKEFCKPSSGETVRVDVNAIINKSLILIKQQLLNRSILLEFDLVQDPIPFVMCCPEKIEQVFINLITNARDALTEKHQRRGGRLKITSEIATGDIVKITFADDGRGIDEETREKLFNPFYSTKAPGTGTGLGLFISLAILRDYSGALACHNNEQGGASFVVELNLVR